jgi:hypothetical protein
MRDLLYLSETKMKDLIPQLPRKVLKRLGMEAGVNVGVLSLRATLAPDEHTSLTALLDSVINMIEDEKLTRWRSDLHLCAGDWVQFEETFLYGTTPPDTKHPLPSGDLVYFNATDTESKRFSLCGSAAHLKGAHYALPKEEIKAPVAEVATMLRLDDPTSADTAASPRDTQQGRFADGVTLSGHARVLAVFDDFILGTPLYVEYASTGH